MEFWNDEVTDRSWKELTELSKRIKFILIGGWAVYLYTKLQKSKDIDVIVDYDTLRVLGSGQRLNKNDRLRKYEVKRDGFDIDIYLPGYSELVVPVGDITGNMLSKREGISLPRQEVLLMLKLGAYADRMNSIKGGKDAIDILGLLFYSGIDFGLLGRLLAKYKKEQYVRLMIRVLGTFDKKMLVFLNMNEKSFAIAKKKVRTELDRLL
jgi:hypothetical protein